MSVRCRKGSAAACKVVAHGRAWRFESSLTHSEGAYVKGQTGEIQIRQSRFESGRPCQLKGRLGTGTPSSPENCRSLDAPVGSTPTPSVEDFGGDAQTVVQRPAKPPGILLPLCVRVAPPPLLK